MNYREICLKARDLGIPKTFGVKKGTLVRQIQVQEGNYPCFGTAYGGECDRKSCVWYDDCMKESRRNPWHESSS